MRSEEAFHVARSISTLGTSEFGGALDALFREFAAFDMSCAFAYHAQSEPIVLCDGYSASVSRSALKSYVRGGYLLDPFYVACISGVSEGLWRMGDLAPDAFFESEFAESAEIHPCISDQAGTLAEEVGFVVTLTDGWTCTYSLMRNRISRRFDPAEFAALATLSPIVTALLSRHWATSKAELSASPPESVESILQHTFADQLTPSQYRVITLILRGHSNQSVAATLHITEGTAKLHRHNAYQRLGISSQAELFRLFLIRLEAD